MSTELTKEMKLTALVLAGPATNRLFENCALQRAAMFSGWAGGLCAFAETLGFTRNEASGITRGWDKASGGMPVFQNVAHLEATIRGEALGKHLYELTHPMSNS